MKKSLWIAIFILIASIFLNSCSNSDNILSTADTELYNIKLSGNTESDIFESSVETYPFNKATSNVFEKPIEKSFEIGNLKVTADQVQRDDFSDGSSHDIYLSADKSIKYIVNSDNDYFYIQAQEDAKLFRMSSELLSEDSLLSNTKQYIKEVLGDFNYNGYVYSCTTKVAVLKEHSAWKDTRNYFSVAENEYETVTSYIIEFRKYIGGLKTPDGLIVYCDGEGNVESLNYYNYDMKWETTNIDKNKMTESIDAFLCNLQEKYKLENYEITSQQLVSKSGKIMLSVTLDLTLSSSDENFAMLCPIIIEI